MSDKIIMKVKFKRKSELGSVRHGFTADMDDSAVRLGVCDITDNCFNGWKWYPPGESYWFVGYDMFKEIVWIDKEYLASLDPEQLEKIEHLITIKSKSKLPFILGGCLLAGAGAYYLKKR